MATNRARTKQKKSRPQTRQTQTRQVSHEHEHGTRSLRGLTFDLCCGELTVGNGLAENQGMFRMDMEAHGFALTILMDSERAKELHELLGRSIDDAKKGVN
jgi:hypothetical protein